MHKIMDYHHMWCLHQQHAAMQEEAFIYIYSTSQLSEDSCKLGFLKQLYDASKEPTLQDETFL